MVLSLPVHLSIHLSFSFLAGVIIWRIWKKPFLAILFSFLGGFLIDLDHFIDYFLAFGLYWKWEYFSHGYEFLKTGKIYVLFHGWEYVIILLVTVFLFRNKLAKTIIASLALGIFFHLVTDVVLNDMPIRAYSITYRAKNDFAIEKIIKSENYEKHLKRKSLMQF